MIYKIKNLFLLVENQISEFDDIIYGRFSQFEQENEIKQKTEVSDSAKDAIEALQVLGYTRREVEEAISKIGESNLTTEEIIKQGLKYLGR